MKSEVATPATLDGPDVFVGLAVPSVGVGERASFRMREAKVDQDDELIVIFTERRKSVKIDIFHSFSGCQNGRNILSIT